jgi:hypothetical protein
MPYDYDDPNIIKDELYYRCKKIDRRIAEGPGLRVAEGVRDTLESFLDELGIEKSKADPNSLNITEAK